VQMLLTHVLLLAVIVCTLLHSYC